MQDLLGLNKMQIAKFELEDGRIAKFEVPDNITPEQAFNLVSPQLNELNNPKKQEVAAPTTAAIPERTYGEVAKDVGAAVATGLGGLGQFPGQLYGLATGDFSETGLYGKAKELEKYGESLKSPGLVAREKASQARIAESEKEGQVSAFFTAIKEIITDPVQLPNFLISQSLQSIPSIAAALVPLVGPAASAEIKALQIAAKTATSVAAREIAEKELKDYVANVAIKTGTRQAIGTGAVQQGADIGTGAYEDIYKKLISQNVPEDQAAEKALGLARAAGASGAAISLLTQNLPGARVLEERLAGMRFGSPGGVGGNIASRLASGVGVGLKEGLTEIPEEVGGKFSQNLAMQQVDPTQSLAEGLGATGGQAFIGGFGLGTVIGSLTNGDSAKIAEEKRSIEQAKLQTQKEQALKQQNLTKTQLGITKEQQQLALPAPDELFKQTSNPLFNPFGNYSAADLGINPEVDAYVKQHRQLTGKPNIGSYSIEDIQDAMPGTNTVAEKAAIDSFLTAKTGYTSEVSYTPQDIQNVATQKNIETKTKGFDDFLTRTTGISNVAEMSQPQLHAAFTALAQLPKSPNLQILPQGTNATRFTEDQYKKSIESLKAVGNNLSREDALNKIYDQIKVPYVEPVDPIAVNKAPDAEAEQRNKTYFEDLQRKNAESILSKALRENDLETVKVPKFDVIAPDGSVTVSPLTRESANRIAEKTEGFTVKESSVEKIAVVDQSVLPKGFDIQQQSFKQDGVPGGYQIKAGNVLISPTAFTTEEEATNKVKSYEAVRAKQIESIDKQLTKLEAEKTKGQNELDAMEVSGSSSTPAYRVASAAYDNQVRGIDNKVVGLNKQKELLAVPLQIIPTGSAIRSGFTVFEQGIPKATLPTKQAAEEHIIANASDETLQNISTSPTPNRLRNKATEEINLRAGNVEPGIRVARSPELAVQADVENQTQMAKLEETLKPLLAKFGLNTTKLKVAKEIDGGKAEASYAGIQDLINIAFDAVNPVRALRHESVHALKELGFFTDGQWKALVNQANTKWVNKYLKQKNISGNPLSAGEESRYEAYMKAYDGNQEAIIEEAIADAFADFDVNGAPAGFMAALLTKIQNFFKALLNSLNGAGFQTAEDIFGKVERGELRGELKSDKLNKIDERKSLKAGFSVPLSTVDLMENDALVSRKELNLKVEKEADERAGQLNNVREIAVSLNNQTVSQFGRMNRNNPTEEDAVKISEAMADEVLYQLGTTSTTGTGLGWYSNNYPNAVKRLSTRFPELKTNQHARAVFTALVAITSNGERVKKNISNAINLYAKLRMGKPLVAMGNRRPTALQNNLKTLEDLLIEHGENFEQHLLKETTVSEMNVQLRARGEKSDASYLAETTVPTAAIYFGPKLGAFYANLSGSEGYLTMDLWWTRTVNRMRGLLIPMATTASIGKFRSMMERPNLTRDEIVSAAIPFRDKYLEYGYNTDLEHLTKSKEPAKKLLKATWFKRAEKVAGDSYDQLLYEHNLEKMANTIYKNEYEMLAEAPFTASDRKFMYDVGRKTQSLLRNQGVSLTLADIQAALWYYEKRLYQKLSGRKADDIGYEEAIIAQANEGTGRARPSVVFIGGVDGGSVATREIESSEGLREEPTAEESKIEGTNENISPREPTVRPSDRSGEGRSAANGTKLSLREDIRSYRERNEAVPETHTRKSIGDGGSVRVLGVKPIAQYSPTESFKGIVNGYGHQSPVFYEISGKNADVYEQAIQESKDASPYGASVYVYPVEEYAKMRLFMTEDGKSGVALKDDDIVSVFSGPPHKGSVNSSIQLALQEGGRRLDAFDTILPDLYQANGFQIVGRMKWNEDYKPDNWNKKTFSEFNNGEPDVVYMAYNPDDNRTVSENPGEYFDDPDELGQAQKDAVNTYFNEGTGYGTAQQTETARRLKAQTGTVSGKRGVRRGLQLLDDETRAKYPNLEEPVKGLPATIKVDGIDVTFGPYIAAREAAILYAEASGIPYQQQASYHKIDPEFSKILASSYARMLDEPNSYQVRAAYKAWADETIAQYKAMLKTGITVEFFPNSIDTYGNPRKSILDVLNNNHLYVFPADGGFGKEAITNEQIKNNPALALTDIIISGRRARVVEVFRATHDFFGHIKEGFGFRAEGEENAFQSHVRMYSSLAARAMTAGTRGQNSEVNFGPNTTFNKTASGKDTKYADQKIGLMPEWATTENIEPNVKYSLGKVVVLGTKQEGSISFSGTHYGKIKTDNLSSSKYGTGLQGSESRRLSGYWDDRIKKRVYFYVPKYDGTMPLPESGVGGYVYTQKFDNIISPAVLSKLYAEARGDANTMETLVVEAGYDGYAAPSMGMMVILNHDVPVNYEGTKAEFDAKKEKYSLRKAPDTPEFKRFFSGSKVVNEDGSPKVMYHGTNKDFNEFVIAEKANRAGMPDGFYFTSDEDDASRYAKGDGASVMPVYLSIKNPFNLGKKNKISNEMVMQFRDELRADNPTLPFDWIQEKVNIFKERTAAGTFPFPSISFPTAAMQRVFKVGGYDGLIDGSRVFVAFNSKQVKSATGNIGTYDPTNPDIRYSLTQKVNSLPNSSKILDSVNKIISVQDQTGHVERMIAAFSPKSRSNFRAAIIDRYNQIGVNSKQVAKLKGENWLLADVSAEAAANMSDLATGVSASALGVGQGKGGIPVYANGFTKVFNDDGKIKGAVEIFSTLAKYNNPEIYRLYQWWAGSLRGKRLLDDGREQKYDQNDIKLAEELLVSFPEFKQVQKEWIVYNDGLVKYAVDTGVLTKEAGEKFKEYGDYIPFYRQIDGEQTVGPNIFSGISGVKGPKALKGSEAPLADFLETIVRNTQSIIESGMKNVAAERAVRDAIILGQAEKLNFQPTSFKSDVVSYQEKGKTVYYRLADPALFEAMKGLNLPDLPWLGILSAPANLLRTLVTKDPGFMLVNLMRDSVSAWITSGSSMTPIVDTMNQFVKTLAGKSPEAEALMMSGVLGGYDFASNVKSGGKDLAKYLRKTTKTKTTTEFLATPFTSVWEALEKGSTASDAATRAAIYRKVMDETGNEAEAIYRALEVMNFNRKGNAAVIRILTAVVPFLNARIQGLDVLYRASFGEMASKDAKAIQKAFIIRGLFLMGMTALYYAATSDDDEYKKQEQEVRDNNWLIPSLGIKIPIPFEIGVLFKVIPERIMAYHYGTDTGKELFESAARNIVSTFAFNPVPQAIIPFVETATNYSFFTGREIVPRELKDVSPEFQTNAGTSGLAKRISSGLADILPSGLKEKSLSPIQIDHIVNGYTGTLGMYASSMLNSVFDRTTDPTRADLRLEQMPVLRRILIDKEAKGNVTAYYDLKHSTDTMVRTINLLEKTQNFEEISKYQQENLNLLATQDYMKDLAKMMKELNEYSVMIKSSQMDGTSKRDALLAINQAQNNVTANIKTIRKMLN